MDESPLTFLPFFHMTFSTMINCQERVSCQLASDLCALCPNHLLRGKRSCLSYYNSLYSHLCHGKGELPCRGLQLTVTRHCSCLVPVCHLCVPCKYCLAEKKNVNIVIILSHNSCSFQREHSFSTSREGINLIFAD